MKLNSNKIQYHKIINGIPKKVTEFGKDFAIELECAIFKYMLKTEIAWKDPEPAFFYSEQRSKTFFTIALSNISNGLVIQEPAIEVRKNKKASGRIDYYFNHNNVAYLMEVKQSWAKYSKNKLYLGKSLNTHKKAIKQVESIKKNNLWKSDFSLALTFVPVYIEYEKVQPTEEEIFQATKTFEKEFKEIDLKSVLYKLGCHQIFIIPFSYTRDKSFKAGSNNYQSYPCGLIFITDLG